MHKKPSGSAAAGLAVCAALLAGGCGQSVDQGVAGEAPFASTYQPLPSDTVLIRDATVLTGTGERLENGDVLMRDGKIAAVGTDLAAPEGARVIEAAGKWVTPGIIDVHSHLGVYPSPSVEAHADGNEMTDPNTAGVWAEHSVWPQDPGFVTALAGGVTTLQILPGSANLFGGRSVVLKNVPARTTQAMKFPEAPYGLKMACGENPKRVYGEKGRAPSTRMGNVRGYREAWIAAREYLDAQSGENGNNGTTRDLGKETLAGVLKGEILVHNHCYRADEMATMIDVAREFDYQITAFHHAVEAYKIADLLAEHDICAAMWADWWGFKMEAYDGVRQNVALVHEAGGCAVVHSDSEYGIQRLNQEAAKAMAAGKRAGLDISRAEAITWITSNAAKALGIAERTGSLEEGKMADVVIWTGDPFSVYSKAEQVFIDGALIWNLHDKARQPETDFTLGLLEVKGELQ